MNTRRKISFTCQPIKIDGEAQKLGEPVELDTTQVGGSNNAKIYTIVVSEDKQWLMAIKINTKIRENYTFTTFLYDKNLELQDRHRLPCRCRIMRTMFTNFDLDDQGGLVFTKYARSGSGEYLSPMSPL